MAKQDLFETIKGQLPENARHRRAWLSIIQLFNSVERVLLRRFALKFDSSLRRFDVLSALIQQPEGMIMGELASVLMVTKGNITAVVRRLEIEKLVRKKTSATDARVSVVTLTRKGSRLWERMHTDYDEVVKLLLSSRSPAQLDNLVRDIEDTRSAILKKSNEVEFD